MATKHVSAGRCASTLVSLFSAGLLLASCSSSAGLSRRNGVSFRVADRAYSQVWNAGVLTIASIGAIESEDRSRGEVRGLRGASAFSWGDAVAIFIDPPDPNARNFVVTVASQHVFTPQVSGQDFRLTMIASMKAHLDLP